MDAIFSIIQVLIAIAMIAIILIQRGPGAAAGSGFGAGASGTVFGARGSGSFLTRTTGLLAVGFFAVSMTMAVLASRTASQATAPDLGVMGEVLEPEGVPEVPTFEVDGADGGDVPAVNLPMEDAAPVMDDVPPVTSPEVQEELGQDAAQDAAPAEETPEP